MNDPYVLCLNCGKRALSVATRCPQCGHEFPPRALAPARRLPDLGRYLGVLAIAVGVVALVMLLVSLLGRIHREAAGGSNPAAAEDRDTAAVAAVSATPSVNPVVAERRYARSWTKVRTRRSTRADVSAVLLPGDTIRVDSLVRGWWRVTLDGKLLGYAHQSTLDTEPPAPK